MRIALLTISCGALVTALSGEALGKQGKPSGEHKIPHGGKNIGNGDGGGINIDTGGGDIGSVGVMLGGGGGGCDPATCDSQCRELGNQSGFCDNGSETPSLLGLILGQTTPPRCICVPAPQDCDPPSSTCNGQCCASGLTCCDGSCVNLDTDISNCGSCGNNCPAGSISTCSLGTLTCQTECDPPSSTCNGQCCASGLTCCDGACVNLDTDISNCGSCGNNCPAGSTSTCSSGTLTCQTECDPPSMCNGQCCASGLTCCDGACVDLDTDGGNCGSCGNTCPPGSIISCMSGSLMCTSTCDTPLCNDECCAPGLTCCDGACVDLNNDPTNCGSCGNTCPSGSTSSCSSGSLSCLGSQI